MNDLQIFTYQSEDIPFPLDVRTVQRDGEPWFVLRDVCQVRSLSDTNKTAERLDPDELTRTKLVSGGQEREMYIINESGLYNVILRSDKPEAKPFRKWVTAEVLPTQRSMDRGWFEVKETTSVQPDGSIRVNRTTKISGKGQQYFIRLFLSGDATA